jgi:DNA invertase Pin-like site-specific DNA recombinase
VSGQDQAENGAGIPIQRKAIEDFCRRERVELVAIAEDAGVSGAIADRPGLVEVEQAIAGGGVEVVIVHRLDRLARDLLVQERLLADWTSRGVKLLSVMEPDLDEDSPERKFVRQLLGAVAELDKARVVARLRWGRQAKARQGGFPGGQVATGYRLEGKRLVVDPEEARVVRRIAAMKRRGATAYRIAKTLNEDGVSTKKGKLWTPAGVTKLLRSAQVRGRISYEGEQVSGKHPALVRGRGFGPLPQGTPTSDTEAAGSGFSGSGKCRRSVGRRVRE